MEIIIARNAGYCFGVKRAVEIATKLLENNKEKRIYSLGEIIHNPQVVKDFKEKGMIVVSDIEEIKDNSIVIISAHGRSESDIRALQDRGCTIIDATCPHVIYPQHIIKKLTGEGYFIILFGDRDHPEVKGLMSYAKNDNILIVDNRLVGLSRIKSQKIGLLAQTTQNREDFMNIITKLALRFKEIRIFNTICDATSIRQEEAVRISKDVDVMVIVGGRNSANTRRLYELCGKYCKKVVHIETAEEVRDVDFDGILRIGITAGASTPDYIIDGVIKRLKRL